MNYGKLGLIKKVSQNEKGFTLMEVVISVGLLAIVSVVSVSIVSNLLRSAVKSQASADIEQTSDFILLKLKNDLSKAVSATVTSDTLTINQGPALGIVSYSILTPANCMSTNVEGCIKRNSTYLTDSTDSSSAVSVKPSDSSFSAVTGPDGVVAVNVVMKFTKPVVSSSTGKNFYSESTLNTTIALPSI